MWAFSTEKVTRAVAGSRIPTIVAIGHEIDFSLSEKASDRRASTPSNAAEIIVPDKKQISLNLAQNKKQISQSLENIFVQYRNELTRYKERLSSSITSRIDNLKQSLDSKASLLKALSPAEILKRGYSIIKKNNKLVRSADELYEGNVIGLQFYDSFAEVKLGTVNIKEK